MTWLTPPELPWTPPNLLPCITLNGESNLAPPATFWLEIDPPWWPTTDPGKWTPFPFTMVGPLLEWIPREDPISPRDKPCPSPEVWTPDFNPASDSRGPTSIVPESMTLRPPLIFPLWRNEEWPENCPAPPSPENCPPSMPSGWPESTSLWTPEIFPPLMAECPENSTLSPPENWPSPECPETAELSIPENWFKPTNPEWSEDNPTEGCPENVPPAERCSASLLASPCPANFELSKGSSTTIVVWSSPPFQKLSDTFPPGTDPTASSTREFPSFPILNLPPVVDFLKSAVAVTDWTPPPNPAIIGPATWPGTWAPPGLLSRPALPLSGPASWWLAIFSSASGWTVFTSLAARWPAPRWGELKWPAPRFPDPKPWLPCPLNFAEEPKSPSPKAPPLNPRVKNPPPNLLSSNSPSPSRMPFGFPFLKLPMRPPVPRPMWNLLGLLNSAMKGIFRQQIGSLLNAIRLEIAYYTS